MENERIRLQIEHVNCILLYYTTPLLLMFYWLTNLIRLSYIIIRSLTMSRIAMCGYNLRWGVKEFLSRECKENI